LTMSGLTDHKPESRGEDGSRKKSAGLRERCVKQNITSGSSPRRTAFFLAALVSGIFRHTDPFHHGVVAISIYMLMQYKMQ